MNLKMDTELWASSGAIGAMSERTLGFGAIMKEDTSKEDLKLIRQRQGYFGNYHVDGKWFENQSSERSWFMMLVPSRAGGSYWVTGEEFRSALMNVELSGKANIGIGEPVTNLEPGIKQVLLNAIQKWEGEPEGL